MPLADVSIWTEWVQYVFAGFSLILLSALIYMGKWMFSKLISVLEQNNTVIAGNTRALENSNRVADETRRTMEDVKDELLKRPCLFQEKQR